MITRSPWLPTLLTAVSVAGCDNVCIEREPLCEQPTGLTIEIATANGKPRQDGDYEITLTTAEYTTVVACSFPSGDCPSWDGAPEPPPLDGDDDSVLFRLQYQYGDGGPSQLEITVVSPGAEATTEQFEPQYESENPDGTCSSCDYGEIRMEI